MRGIHSASSTLLDAILARIDGYLGMPVFGRRTGSGIKASIAEGRTLHYSQRVAHPTIAGRWRLPLGPEGESYFAAVKADAAAKVVNGTATAGDSAIAAGPMPADSGSDWEITSGSIP